MWSSRFDTAAALVLGDGTVLAAHLDGLGNEQLGKVLDPWVSSLQLATPTTDRQRKGALALLGEMLTRLNVPELLKHTLTKRWAEDPKGPGWRWGPVTLVVSGVLSFIPVHVWTPCIIEEATGKPRYHMPLMCAPSARQALVARRSPRPTSTARRLLSIADPEPLVDGLTALPLARVESELIARTARHPLLLHGRQATPQAFLEHAGRFDVVHLACHGSVDTEAPGQATLALSGGRLTLDEIVSSLVLDDIALVLLTACRSGQADSVIPDETLDIGSTFLAAGARSVVSSMWPVDELAATLFLWQLFRLWDWGEGLPLPAAVHGSRLWLRDLTVADLTTIGREEKDLQRPIETYNRLLPLTKKRFDEPYYWATFTYAGG